MKKDSSSKIKKRGYGWPGKKLLQVLISWECSATKDREGCITVLHKSQQPCQQTQLSYFKWDSTLQFRARGTAFCPWFVTESWFVSIASWYVGCERFNMKVVNMSMLRLYLNNRLIWAPCLSWHALKFLLKTSKNVISYAQDEQSLSFDPRIVWTYA